MTPFITSKAFYNKLKNLDKLTLLDIRDKKSFLNCNVYDSINIPLNELPGRIGEIPLKNDVVVISHDGKNISKTYQLLKKRGINSYILEGGIKSWNNIYDIVYVNQNKSPLNIIQVKRLAKGCLSYIIFSEETKKCVIIDPSRHINIYLEELKKNQLIAVAVADTHIHSDHFSGAPSLSGKLKVPYLLPQASKVKSKFLSLEQNLPQLFPKLKIEIIKTSGHTDDSVIIIINNSVVFAGDTIYIDAIPPIDIDQDIYSSTKDFYLSITNHIMPLKDSVFLFPSHTPLQMVPGPIVGATARYVKMFTIIKYAKNENNFKKIHEEYKTEAKDTYQKIKEANIKGKIPKSNADEMELCAQILAAHPL